MGIPSPPLSSLLARNARNRADRRPQRIKAITPGPVTLRCCGQLGSLRPGSVAIKGAALIFVARFSPGIALHRKRLGGAGKGGDEEMLLYVHLFPAGRDLGNDDDGFKDDDGAFGAAGG